MTTDHARSQFSALREDPGPIDTDVLDALWAELDTVAAADILGPWKGSDLATGHPLSRALVANRWHGKRFDALDDAKPLICRADDGSLYSNTELGRGEASLWDVGFRGEVTAAMVYDNMAVVDHFKKVDDDTLMGIMNGTHPMVLHEGRHYYFVLERDA